MAVIVRIVLFPSIPSVKSGKDTEGNFSFAFIPEFFFFLFPLKV